MKKNEKSRAASLEAVGVKLEDTGKAVVLRVGGAAYKTLKKAAEAMSRTFVEAPTLEEVFLRFCLPTDELTEPGEMASTILDDCGFKRGPDREAMLADLRRNLLEVGLLKREKKPSKKSAAK